MPKRNRVGDVEKAMGERIRLRRMQIGMSQTELGRRAGVTFQQVQKYETGANAPSPSRLVLLCAALDSSLDYLFGVGSGTADKKGRPGKSERELLSLLQDRYVHRAALAFAAIPDRKARRLGAQVVEHMGRLLNDRNGNRR